MLYGTGFDKKLKANIRCGLEKKKKKKKKKKKQVAYFYFNYSRRRVVQYSCFDFFFSSAK